MPVTWLVEHGGPSIRFRTLHELTPPGAIPQDQLATALRDLVTSPLVSAVTTRQDELGMWGGNLLAFQPSSRDEITEPGTVAQYRRLIQLGVPVTTRPFRLAERFMYRALSRDDDPRLLGEFEEEVFDDPETLDSYRDLIRDGICAALAEAGHGDDPRLRGAAHKVVNAVSSFLRSDLAARPLVKKGDSWYLHAGAAPPSWWSVAMVAAMPSLRRERAGFVDRLVQYLAHPAPAHSFSIPVGRRMIRSTHLILGDPIHLDPKQKGMPRDVPLALHFLEVLAGLGPQYLAVATNAAKAFARLLEDVDTDGVWHPKNLRSQPKAGAAVTWHCWPLSPDDGDLASRQADITFRLALIAKRLGWQLEYS